MKITKRWLRKQTACEEAIIWFCNQKITNSNQLILLAIEENEEFHLKWANWILVRSLNDKKRIKYLIFAVVVMANRSAEDVGYNKTVIKILRYGLKL